MANAVLFKMMVTNSKTCILLFTYIFLIHLSSATITIGVSPTEVKTSASFAISCTVSDLSQDVVFYRGNTEIGKCTASLIPGFPGSCLPGFSQDVTTNITTYSVASANATTNEGTWTCKHNPDSSNALMLTVYGFPSNPIDNNQAYLPNKIDATNMDSTQFTVNVSECVNPAPTISWTFFQDCDGTSINPILITSTTSDDPAVDCSSPYSAYKNTVKVTDMKKVVDGDHCFNVRSVVGYPRTSFTNKTVTFLQNITFTSKSEENSNDNTLKIVGGVLGGVCGVGLVAAGSKLVKKQASVKNSEADQSKKTKSNNGKQKDKTEKPDVRDAVDVEGGGAAADNAGVKPETKSNNGKQKDKTEKPDVRDAVDVEGGGAAADSAGVKPDGNTERVNLKNQNSEKENQKVYSMNEETLKNKDASNVEQKGKKSKTEKKKDNHTDDKEHKETTDEAAVAEDQITLLSGNTS